MVLVKSDYEDFKKNKTYIAAKLLTYFAEHSIFVFGYAFGDPNVATIIAELGRLISDEEGLIRNVFFVRWDADAEQKLSHPVEHLITYNAEHYRVRAISTNDLSWIFECLAKYKNLSSVNTQLVRALAARTYKLIRNDIPKGSVEVDYKVLEQISESEKMLPTLLGISSVTNINQAYPYTITMLADELGLPSWNRVHRLIARIKNDKNYNMLHGDNGYFCSVRTGKKSRSGKFSKAALHLLEFVRDEKSYSIDKGLA